MTVAHGTMIPVHIHRAINEGAIVIIGPDGMGEPEIKGAVVDALLGLKREPERPRVYLMVATTSADSGTDNGSDRPEKGSDRAQKG